MRAKSKKNKVLDQEKTDEFLSGANYADLSSKNNVYPWENLESNSDKVRKFTLRIPEEYALKLDFLTKNSMPKTSNQRYILEVLIPLIDKELKKKEGK